MSDSPIFHVSSNHIAPGDQVHLADVLTLGFAVTGNSKAHGYTVLDKPVDSDEDAGGLAWSHVPFRGTRAFVLCWHESARNFIPFPSPIGPREVAPLVLSWLSVEDYPPEPDQDGSNQKGWRVWTDPWGIVNGDHYSFLGVAPHWEMYGK